MNLTKSFKMKPVISVATQSGFATMSLQIALALRFERSSALLRLNLKSIKSASRRKIARKRNTVFKKS